MVKVNYSKKHVSQEAKPLIQAMDQDVLKSMLKHKNHIASCFFSFHPDANNCASGQCEHDKVGTTKHRISSTNDDGINKIIIDESPDTINVCIYMMPIIGHLVDYELFKTFLPEDQTEF